MCELIQAREHHHRTARGTPCAGEVVKRVAFHTIVILVCTSMFFPLLAQNQPLSSHNRVVSDRTLGISFLQVGKITRESHSIYQMLIESDHGVIEHATAEIFLAQRPSVDLPGSYGGQLYLNDVKSKLLSENVVAVDTLIVHGLKFRRDYWAVYAGMGMWEGVINCYAFGGQQYYNVSLDVGINAGKPGEDVNGQTLDTHLLRNRVAKIICDSHEPAVQKFNELLLSFQLTQTK